MKMIACKATLLMSQRHALHDTASTSAPSSVDLASLIPRAPFAVKPQSTPFYQ